MINQNLENVVFLKDYRNDNVAPPRQDYSNFGIPRDSEYIVPEANNQRHITVDGFWRLFRKINCDTFQRAAIFRVFSFNSIHGTHVMIPMELIPVYACEKFHLGACQSAVVVNYINNLPYDAFMLWYDFVEGYIKKNSTDD